MLHKMSYQQVMLMVQNICIRLGRNSEEITVIAVSKLQPIEKISELIELRHSDFGENYIQEALPKLDFFSNQKLNWHLIGHLQTNKVKQIIGKFEYIHSVDSLKLAKTISEYAQTLNVVQKVLIQVNIAQEDTKSGFDYTGLLLNWPALIELKNIQICGLMTMPPLSKNPEDSRPHFQELKKLLAELKFKIPDGTPHTFDKLSMGTSHDFEVAIEEGANMIRLGTVLFGERK